MLQAEDTVDEHNERFLNYFRSRALAENGIAGALSPNQAPGEHLYKKPKRISIPLPQALAPLAMSS